MHRLRPYPAASASRARQAFAWHFIDGQTRVYHIDFLLLPFVDLDVCSQSIGERIMMESMTSLVATQLSPQEAGKRAEALALQQQKGNKKKKDSIATLASHAGIENIHNAPLAPPLHVATT